MDVPIVHHPVYSIALPAPHHFPMGKFAALAALLRARGLLAERNLFLPEPVSPELLELAHASCWVRALLEGTVDPASQRRVGLPITPTLVQRALASAGVRSKLRASPSTMESPATPREAATTPVARQGQGFACSTTLPSRA